MPLPKEQRIYTYADYLNWPEEERLEIIDGVVYAQATPSFAHQTIVGNLYLEIGNYLKGKQCRVFTAPFSVRLPLENGETDDLKNRNVVEPDLAVVCDKSKADKGGYNGAPTLIIEVVSKSSMKRDNIVKLNKYQQAGVQEYWIVIPGEETIIRYALQEEKHYGAPEYYVLGEDAEINTKVLPDLTIQLKNIFAMWE